MNILVLIKEVPDMGKVKFDSERGTVDRSSANTEINPFDESALQVAVNLKAKTGAQIVAMTMGPAKAVKSLKEAYARGADTGILITDRAFGGSDTIATARTLAESIKLGNYDLILCGEKSVDGDTAQVGAEVAEILGLPHSYYCDSVELTDEGVKVSIENLCGKKQIRTMPLPAVIGVTKNAAKLKLPTVNRKLESLHQEFTFLNLVDIPALSKENTGFNGSPTKVAKIEIPETISRESKIYKEDVMQFIGDVKKEIKSRGII